jgi:large subunit ribosomal protein L18
MADKNIIKDQSRIRRKLRSRSKMFGTAERPRLVIYKSLNQIYAQVLNDQTSVCITGASSLSKELKSLKMPKKEKSAKVGELIAARAKDKGIEKVVFDRSGYPYHGRIKALADGARKGGLKF